MELISSRQNPKVKYVKSLRERKGRQTGNTFLVEGIRPVGEAFEAGADIQAVFYAPHMLDSDFAHWLIEAVQARGIACYAVSEAVFRSMAEKENPQGILAVVREVSLSLESLSPQNFSWGVALVSPQDPGNLGAILRSVDAVGADGVLVLDGGVDVYHPSVVRASMGTIFWHPLVCTSFDAFEAWAKMHRYHVFGTSAHASRDYRMVESFPRPRLLLMGSEREGLQPRHLAICEASLRLPMQGRASSLNLAIATGVFLYAMLACDEANLSASSNPPDDKPVASSP